MTTDICAIYLLTLARYYQRLAQEADDLATRVLDATDHDR